MSCFKYLLIFLKFFFHQIILWSYLNAQFLYCFENITLHFLHCKIPVALIIKSLIFHQPIYILLIWTIDFLSLQNLEGLLQIDVRYLKRMEALIFFHYYHYQGFTENFQPFLWDFHHYIFSFFQIILKESLVGLIIDLGFKIFFFLLTQHILKIYVILVIWLILA